MSYLLQSCGSAQGREQGFTLIESLVALVLAATAAAIILARLHSLVAQVEQQRAHELAVLRLLNEATYMTLGSPGGEQLTAVDVASVQINYRDPDRPVVRVQNFSATGEVLPPVTLAYTPFQRYSVSAGVYTLSVLAPGIQRPDVIKPSLPAPAVVSEKLQSEPPQPLLTPIYK